MLFLSSHNIGLPNNKAYQRVHGKLMNRFIKMGRRRKQNRLATSFDTQREKWMNFRDAHSKREVAAKHSVSREC